MLSFNKAFGGVTIGHIDYSLNTEKYTAVLQRVNPEAIVAGILTIPQFVTYEKKNYEVVEIGDHVCSDSSVKQLLEWINFPVSIEVVGEGAFENCINLWSCSWPGDATKKIGACAFAGCKKLQDFSFPPLLEKIGGRALAGCTDIQALIIGGELEEVPFGLCEGCTSLTEVVVFSGLFHRMKKIQDNAFDGCTNMVSVSLPSSLKSIEYHTFYNCRSLHTIDIPSSVRKIGEMAFQNCRSLSKLVIPNSVKSIGLFAFEGCSGMETLTISSQLTAIEQYTFSGCSRLKILEIPNSVTFIDEWAFYGCSGLEKITIPNSVNYIGEWAFTNCDAIAAVFSEIEIPFSIGQYVFERGVKANACLHVPAGTKDAYQDASGWDFKNIIEETPELYNLVIWAKDGSKIAEYALTEMPKVTFEPGAFVISSASTEIESYELDRLARFTYEKIESTGIEDIVTDDVSFSINGETLIFSSLKANSLVSVYALNGTSVFSKRIDQAGQYAFPLTNLTRGIYLIHVNDSTYKIVKK